jgi:cobalt/nickel transport system ATP-binding protein
LEVTVFLDVETLPAEENRFPSGATAPGGLLVCRDVSYAYLGRFPALDRVSLTVSRGESVAMLGANGSGKSTLLKILDGLIFPDSGAFEAFGQAVTEDTIEDERFSPTVREEIAFGLLQMGMPPDSLEERITDIVRALGIDGLVGRAPYQLSGGEKKKVAIASVLVMNPEVLLFDEPTAALDPRSQQWLMDLIVELRRAGKTIVLATHDLEVLEAITTRCLVFSEDHRIVAEGTPAGILGNRDLLIEVNLIHAHSHRHGEVSHRHEHVLKHHDAGA